MSKGSRDRTKDHKAYRESLDRVFGSPPKIPTDEELWKMMSTVYPATTGELIPVKDKNLNDGDEEKAIMRVINKYDVVDSARENAEKALKDLREALKEAK